MISTLSIRVLQFLSTVCFLVLLAAPFLAFHAAKEACLTGAVGAWGALFVILTAGVWIIAIAALAEAYVETA